jgi:hypothetical protein
MTEGYLLLLAAIIRQAARDWGQLHASDAEEFLDAAGLLDRAATIAGAWHTHQAVAGRPGRRRDRVV